MLPTSDIAGISLNLNPKCGGEKPTAAPLPPPNPYIRFKALPNSPQDLFWGEKWGN